VSYSWVYLSSISDLHGYPLSPEESSSSVEINVKGGLSHALVIGFLFPYGQTLVAGWAMVL